MGEETIVLVFEENISCTPSDIRVAGTPSLLGLREPEFPYIEQKGG